MPREALAAPFVLELEVGLGAALLLVLVANVNGLIGKPASAQSCVSSDL